MRFIYIFFAAFATLTFACQKQNLNLSGNWKIINWVEGEGNYYVNNGDNEASLVLNENGSLKIETFDNEKYVNLGTWEVGANSTITLDFSEGEIFADTDDVNNADFVLANDTLKITGTTGTRPIYMEMVKSH